VSAAPPVGAPPLVGILAIQGGFEAHERVLARLGAETREVRVPADLEGLDALVMPGGESTVMTLGIEREGLADPLRELAAAGKPILGTCAGMIMLDRDHLGILDVLAQRNAFGRQLHSFEADFDVAGVPGGPFHAIFIRAPWIAEHGPEVSVLADVDGHPVAIQQGKILALSFHPELTGEDRLHRFFLDLAGFDNVGVEE
jgi:pyridoxal 5'-phosphate synthase pdxT subunit